MPFNGSGQFSPKHVWANEAAGGTPMLPANFDDQDTDMAAALSNAILRDGTGGPTTDIPWNNFGITGMRDPVQKQEAATKNYVDVVDAAIRTWVGGTTQALPAQAGNAGKALITDGTTASWQQAYPAQAGNGGRFLVTDGTAVSWTSTLKASLFRLNDGSDATKYAAFDLSGLTTATVRTYTLPNASGTLALRTDIAMQLLAQATVGSAVANIDFLSVFTSAYDKYVVEIQDLTAATADLFCIRMAKAGAVDATSVYSQMVADAATSALNNSSYVSPNNNVGSTNAATLTLEFRNVNSTNTTKTIGARGMTYAVGTQTWTGVAKEGAYTAGSAATGFRLYCLGGTNFTSGTVRVYGVKNS